MKRTRSLTRLGDLLVRVALLAALWWVLVEGEMYGIALAGVVLLVALVASVVTVPAVRSRLTLRGVAGFVPFFLAASLRGGLDVARRAFDPRRPLSPGFVEHRLVLPHGPARLFFAGTVSLLPGTLSVELHDQLRLHVLDVDSYRPERIIELEDRVGALFGLSSAARQTDR